ncbi:hypothetical protein DPMN_020155 [Dreissena polymorpha]|uniref:Uncharacterized protein n=1 Tax=Dreissena polymorpha TaxID=45954 RepID=A0A9D4NJQ9_DREPO|nr:hypothetical protein DPMN_020155 [Dreissena polymorpha]
MDISCSGCSQHNHYCFSASASIYRSLGVHSIVMTAFLFQHECIVLCFHSQVITAFLCQHGCIVFYVHSQVITAFLCQHGCIVLWVFTTKSLLPFCVSMDVLCSGCSQHSHYKLSVSAWIYLALGVHSIVLTSFLCQHRYILLWVFTTKSLLPFCVSMDVLCCGCSQHSHYCLSVSAWIYLALGIHSIVITAFLCQHGYILIWVFTTKSLLPFCVSMDVLCSGCSQPSHYCLSVSARMYRALGVHNQVITAFMCQHGCIALCIFTTKSLPPFFVSMDVSCSGYSQPSHYCLSLLVTLPKVCSIMIFWPLRGQSGAVRNPTVVQTINSSRSIP